MPLPLISIQILNWNRAEESIRAIKSAKCQTYPNIEIVFIDNGSTDDSVALVRDQFPNVKVVELEKNYGCPEGRNRGIDQCSGDFIFFLDNDGLLHREAVAIAYETIITDNKIGVVAGTVYDFEDTSEIDLSVSPKSEKSYLNSDFQGGICLHRKSIYSKVGKYPGHFFYGGEESYLSCKLLDSGYKIVKDDSVILWHKKSNLGRNAEKELLNRFYNKLFICANLYPIEHAILFILFFPIKYLVHAYNHKVHKQYITTFFQRYSSTVFSALRSRHPIKRSTYKNL